MIFIKKNVLITAVGGRSVGSGLLHALTRSSEEVKKRWNIIASDADSFAWGLYVVEQAVLLPLANSADYWNSLIEIIKKYNIDAIIPGSEPEVNLLSSVFHLFVVTTEHTDAFVKHLAVNDIVAAFHYPVPCHLQKAYAHLKYKKGDCRTAEYLAEHCMSLPMYAELSNEDIGIVIATINSY